jgi:ATP-dependent Clp protease ATP-binding subunit ClpA
LATQEIGIELTSAARALIVREGTDPTFGARPLKRTIQRLVENPLARAIVAGEFRPGDHVVADADLVSGTLVFSTQSATVVTEGVAKRDARSRRPDPTPGPPVPTGDRLN